MWKPAQNSDNPNTPAGQPTLVPPPPTRTPFPNPAAPLMAQPPQAMIGKGLVIKGEISGTESLYIDGRVEGSIELPEQYLHIGEHAEVKAKVNARELIVRGKLQGNAALGDRLDIRSGGMLVGDVTARRVSIEDGAYFHGSIDMRREQKSAEGPAEKKEPAATAAAGSAAAASA